MNVLFLDDNKVRHRNFKQYAPYAKFVEDASSAICELTNADRWTLVFLDHDLNGEEYVDSGRDDCGMEVVRWICEHKPDIQTIVCHTANAEAGKTMAEKLTEAGYDARQISFYRLIFEGEIDPLISGLQQNESG